MKSPLTSYPHHAMSVSLRQSQPVKQRDIFIVGDHKFRKMAKSLSKGSEKVGYCATPTKALNEVHACLLRMSQLKVDTPVFVQFDQTGWYSDANSKRLAFSYKLDPKSKPKNKTIINLEQTRQTFFLLQTSINGMLLGLFGSHHELPENFSIEAAPSGWSLVQTYFSSENDKLCVIAPNAPVDAFISKSMKTCEIGAFEDVLTQLANSTEK